MGDGSAIKWEEVFDNNPKMSKTIYPGCPWVLNSMHNRPYIDNLKSTPERFVYNQDFRAEPGEIFLTDEEKQKYADEEKYGDMADFIYIEPNTKGTFGGNKDWGFERWQSVVRSLPGIKFVQGKGRALSGVKQIDTGSFREACALLSRGSAFVGTDGGLHHAAAALGKRAVVVWGGLVSPKILGYPNHINLHSGTHSCGSTTSCKHCRQALDWVTVEMVREAIMSI